MLVTMADKRSHAADFHAGRYPCVVAGVLASLPIKPRNLLIQGLPLGPPAHECLASWALEFAVAVLDTRDEVRAQLVDALRQEYSNLAEQAVREGGAFLDHLVYMPCRTSTPCCTGDFIGTQRMWGRIAASRTALASRASFLTCVPPVRCRVPELRGVRRTSWPSACNRCGP
jgi:hypothetical protein